MKKNEFDNKIVKESLTFDDVLLIPEYSEVLPNETDTTVKLTNSITLNIPLMSAPMDTVTEARLAIALAQEGGFGIIHKNMTPEQQNEEVARVKRSESGMIVEPVTLSPDNPISEALRLMKMFSISGIPVTKDNKLVGIITHRDLRFKLDLNSKISDVMTKESLITAPVGTTLELAKAILQKHRIEKLPVVDEHNNLKGLITYKDISKNILYPKANKDMYGRLRVGAAVGTGKDAEARAELLIPSKVDILVIDTAHGHSKRVLDTVKMLKKKYPENPVPLFPTGA